MPSPECQNFNYCEATLCPMDGAILGQAIWYPGEDICNRNDFRNLLWIRRQKRIMKMKIPAPVDRFFTVAMLESIKKIQRGIEGINPDQPLREARNAEKTWIMARGGTYNIAKSENIPQNSIAEKKNNSARPSKTTNRKTTPHKIKAKKPQKSDAKKIGGKK